ncbi:THO complex subunit 2 [Chamberlinius hualienensis]
MAMQQPSELCVTTQMCKNWDKSGKNDFLRHCKSATPSEKDSKGIANCGNSKDLKRIVYDLCWHVIKSNLKVEHAVSVLPELIAMHSETASILMDVFVIIEMEIQISSDKSVKDRFIQLLTACLSIIPERFSKERLDLDCLSEIGILKNKKFFYTKFIKTKTKLFYKQQKFNLLREESEGYAKLICELNQPFIPPVDSAYLLEVIKSLIGCFNLDPNRVLDVILESFENRPSEKDVFIPLIQSYMCNQTTLCEMLGFKFRFYQDAADADTPESLYTTAALMIQHDLISLNGIYPYLKPDDTAIVEEHKKTVQDAKTYARNMYIVSTTDKPAENNSDEDKDSPEEQYRANQKLGLCEALLKLGNWRQARNIMTLLPSHYATHWTPITKSLCKIIHHTIEPLYRKHGIFAPGNRSRKLPVITSEYAPKPLESFAEFRDSVMQMVCALGPHLHTDPILMVKIARLARAYLLMHPLSKDDKPKNDGTVPGLEFDFITILDEALLPSLSLLDCNCCMAEEIWNLLKLYPYQHRFRLYGLWKNETFASHPLIIRKKADYTKKIKYIMKRLSKENVKPSGRQIGKLSHSNPGCLFQYILSQIQTWDNLIIPVVDSLKYLTNLSYDVLSYCIIEALANPDKTKMTHDGTSISPWLQSLSAFCGAIYKKYSIELNGLLQYVANNLKAEKSLDLIILKEIVQKMAGIETMEEITDDQLLAMTGGELLRAEGGYFSQIRNTKKSSQRLKDALLEQDLAIPLCLLMAQQRNCIVYKEQEGSHLKLVGKLYDQCQDTLVQFGSFLSTNLSMDDYVRRLPAIDSLMGEFRIPSDVAFFLSRPMFSHAIVLKFDEMKRQDRSYKNAEWTEKMKKYLDIVRDVMKSAVESVRLHYPIKIWDDISPVFYVTFWSLSMYDLQVPTVSYEKEITKLKLQIAQIEENKEMVQNKKKKEIDRCKTLKDKLQEEEKKQLDHCDRILARLHSEKDSWFLSRSAKNETITQFLQLCIFPRCVFTAMDAIYCSKFVRTIHNLKTPNFSTLICYDRIFCDITYSVTCCTENEANRYGRFLCDMLATVVHWHSDKSIFEKECANYPGFVTRFRVANQPSESSCDHVDYENYRHVCHKWHYKITKALVICLESGDYVQIRNALIVLTKILPYYPIITNLGQVIEKRVENVKNEEKEKRPDLYVLAIVYSGQLKSKKPSMIPEHEFHQKEVKSSSSSGSSTATNANQTIKTEPSSKSASNSSSAHVSENHSPENTNEAKEKPNVPVVKVEKSTPSKPAPEPKPAVSNNSTGGSSIPQTPVKAQSGKRAGSPKVASSSSKEANKESPSPVPTNDKELVRTSKSREEKVSRVERVDHVEENVRVSSREKREESKEKDNKSNMKSSEVDREKKVERASSVTSSGSGGGSHGQRRSVEAPAESEREIKRRKVEPQQAASGKSPYHEETKSRQKTTTTKDGENVTVPQPSQERKVREKVDRTRDSKNKDREKNDRKRDRPDEKVVISGVSGEPKRRKDDESSVAGKSSGRQNGDSETRDKDRHKRDESPERKGRSRDEKKQYPFEYLKKYR